MYYVLLISTQIKVSNLKSDALLTKGVGEQNKIWKVKMCNLPIDNFNLIKKYRTQL